MEELKLILDMVQNLGGEAKWIAIVWLCLKVLTPIITGTVIIIVFRFAYIISIKALNGHQFGSQVMELFKGALWVPRHRMLALKWLSELEDLLDIKEGEKS